MIIADEYLEKPRLIEPVNEIIKVERGKLDISFNYLNIFIYSCIFYFSQIFRYSYVLYTQSSVT